MECAILNRLVMNREKRTTSDYKHCILPLYSLDIPPNAIEVEHKRQTFSSRDCQRKRHRASCFPEQRF